MTSQTSDDQKLAQDMKAQLLNCIGFEGDDLGKARQNAYDYYFQRERGDEVAGRSTIVTGDLSSMVEGNLAQMVEPLSNRRIAEFCAYDEADEEQAQLESDCVNELIFKKQNGFIELVSAIKDAMLLRNGVIKIYVDRRTFKTTIRKENVEPAVIEDLLRSIEQQQSVRGVETKVEVHKYDPTNKKISFTVIKETNKFTVEALAPENFLVPKNWNRYNLTGIPFCAERHVEPRSALIERGFAKELVDEIPKFQNRYHAAVNARLPRDLTPNSVAVDSSAEEVEWYECYCLFDDGNGASELRKVSVAGNILLDDEETSLIGYAVGCIFINPHSFVGISLYDKLKSSQDVGTALTRALLDNLNTTSKNRVAAFDGVVEETDLTDGRTNGVIRVKPGMGIQDVRQAVSPLSVPDTSANVLANLDHQRKVRSEMGGASLDMATGQMQLSDRVGSQGLDRAYSVMEQLAAFMTRTMAQTLIRDLYLVAHETLRTQWKGPICFKRGKDWIKQVPAQWQTRESVQVNLGASINERARISATLEKMMAQQEKLAGLGMEEILVDVNSYYRATMAWLRINDIPNPEQYFVDPRTPAAQAAFKNRAVVSKQAQQKQDALLQQAIGLEQVKAAIQKYTTDANLQFQYWDSTLKAEIEEAKLTIQGLVDFVKVKTEALEAMNGNENTKAISSNGAANKSTAGRDSSGVSN